MILLGGVFSLIITLMFLPILIRFAESRQYFVQENFRRVHKGKVSALGGIAIFLSTFLSVIFFSDFVDFIENRFLLMAGVIMFFIGLRDDFKEVNAWVKLVGQFVVAGVVVYLAGFRIDHFTFFQNVVNINDPWSGYITMVFIVAIVNAYNLIDGVDLQATLIALVVLTPFGWWFFTNHQYDLGLLLLSLGASLLGFAIYNYSPAKIFLGDMGTLIIGLLLSITFIRFSQLHDEMKVIYEVKNPYIFVLASFVLPISDMVRVGATRMLRGRSPLQGDRNHIHHWLLKLGWKQNQIALFTSGFTLLMIVFNFISQVYDINSYLLVVIDLLAVVLMYMYFAYRLRIRVKKTDVAE